MRRIVRLLPRRQVTLRIAAIGRLDRQSGIIAQMALIATSDLPCRRNLMRIGQGEAGAGVVES